jgi:uncharacterized protein YdhG (YjbR/CyaY superfamily)
MPKSKHDPEAVDAYLAGLPDAERRTLEDLRRLIKGSVPDIEERISYGTSVIFAVKRDLVGFVAQAKHLSFFTMSPELASSMRDEIEATHKMSGATIHFTPNSPLPRSLVKKILRARRQENDQEGQPVPRR